MRRVAIVLAGVLFIATLAACSAGPEADPSAHTVGYYQNHAVVLHEFPQPSDNCALAATATVGAVVTTVASGGTSLLSWALTGWGSTGLEDACGGSWAAIQTYLDFKHAVGDCVFNQHVTVASDCLVSGFIMDRWKQMFGESFGTNCIDGSGQWWWEPFGTYHGLGGLACA